MNDQLMRDLLHEVADDIEPADRLDAIRAATGRRTHRGWWAAGGAALVAASVVTAFALTTGGSPRRAAPDVATPAPTSTATDPVRTEGLSVTVYYAGEAPAGVRLYRERRQVDAANPVDAAVVALGLTPLDADYRTLWPADVIRDWSFDGVGDDGQIGVTVDPSVRERPASITPEEASLAVEQVVRTLQVATESSAPVQFYADGNPIDQVLGVPTSEPLAPAPDLDVLSRVNLLNPDEGQEVDNDGGLVVEGLANSFEGNVVIRVQRWEGTAVVAEVPTIAGWGGEGLYPFIERLNLFDVPAGEYVVIAQTDDPSGQGMSDTDTKRITVVD
ncbi:Gmad2 immunoglobulin-like domain-containing protein [Nocardioides sp.]|uniref:Gmad2 immunoglobulin-like domain-containing protein n=1 Tax=Nocardioides sp. TaxID=35761 RepID=UPI0035B3A7D8